MKLIAKIILLIASLLLLSGAGCAQPNSQSRYQVWINNPDMTQQYTFFKEVVTDTMAGALAEGIDYKALGQDTSLYMFTPDSLHIGIKVNGDTTWGGVFYMDDQTSQKYIHCAAVMRDPTTGKYSAMNITTPWVKMPTQVVMKGQIFMRRGW